ncbi:hypothetical protein [Neisseria dentiae]|uniref:hypothetical protein n=1 Tax=Neisseria dentiae TaxID=194197 RepID=UPI00359F815F
MSDLDDFVKNNTPSGKKSKLDAFAREIFALKKLGYSEKDILRFLSEKKGVSVTQPTLNRFIRNRKQHEIPASTAFTHPEPHHSGVVDAADNAPKEQKQDGERIPTFEWNPGSFNIDQFVGTATDEQKK